MFHPKDELRGKYIKALDRQISAYIGEKNSSQISNENNDNESSLLTQGAAFIIGCGIVFTLIFSLIVAS